MFRHVFPCHQGRCVPAHIDPALHGTQDEEDGYQETEAWNVGNEKEKSGQESEGHREHGVSFPLIKDRPGQIGSDQVTD